MIGLATPATIGSIVRMVTGGAGRKVVVHGGGRIFYRRNEEGHAAMDHGSRQRYRI